MSTDRKEKAVEAAVNALSEYFDSIQVFVSSTDKDGNTKSHALGKGNLFARIYQTSIWSDAMDSEMRDMSIGDDDDEEEENA